MFNSLRWLLKPFCWLDGHAWVLWFDRKQDICGDRCRRCGLKEPWQWEEVDSQWPSR